SRESIDLLNEITTRRAAVEPERSPCRARLVKRPGVQVDADDRGRGSARCSPSRAGDARTAARIDQCVDSRWGAERRNHRASRHKVKGRVETGKRGALPDRMKRGAGG